MLSSQHGNIKTVLSYTEGQEFLFWLLVSTGHWGRGENESFCSRLPSYRGSMVGKVARSPLTLWWFCCSPNASDRADGQIPELGRILGTFALGDVYECSPSHELPSVSCPGVAGWIVECLRCLLSQLLWSSFTKEWTVKQHPFLLISGHRQSLDQSGSSLDSCQARLLMGAACGPQLSPACCDRQTWPRGQSGAAPSAGTLGRT